MNKRLYLIGSLRNPEIADLANLIEKETGIEIFASWAAAGPEADDYWKKYETDRGQTYEQALKGFAAQHVFSFDKHHLDNSDGAILALPAGKSGHLELGYVLGRGKPGFILLDDPDRWDVMYNFATGVYTDVKDLIKNVQFLYDPEFGKLGDDLRW